MQDSLAMHVPHAFGDALCDMHERRPALLQAPFGGGSKSALDDG